MEKQNQKSHIINKKCIYDSINKVIINNFNNNDILTNTLFDNDNILYTYDYLNRLIKYSVNNNFDVEYKYRTNGNRTTNMISNIKLDNLINYKYLYDKMNNLTHIFINDNLCKKYNYDEFSQLIREDDYAQDITYRYKYDNSGNILSKNIYKLNSYELIESNNYIYDDQNWKDKLTKYNNQTIAYDDIGNPLTFGDATLTWKNGRELSSFVSNNKNITYKYNENGIRTSKIVNNIETKYFVEDFKIIFEKTGNNTIYYLYDIIDNLIGFEYNSVKYYYLKNNVNDIIGIINSSGDLVCSYYYDSFGSLISIKDANGNDISSNLSHIGNINPFRYQSYYYDSETQLYYLNSRYYSPILGRFINADGIVEPNSTILGYNLFVYSNNNYINVVDNDGYGFWLALGAVVVFGIIIGVGMQALSDGAATAVTGEKHLSDKETYAGAAAGGIVTTAGAAIGVDPFTTNAASVYVSDAVTAGLYAIENDGNFDDYFSYDETLVNMLIAGALGSAGNEMKGINSGRNSYKGIYKSTITKASHGTIDKISAKTAYKSLAYLYLDNAPVAISLSEIHELFPFDTEDEKIISEYSPYYSIPELPKYDWDAPRMCELEPSK